jgi:crotonobetaine/carnitine-CoA ligase
MSGEQPATQPATTQPATLAEAVRAAAERWPDRVAWRFDPGETLTFAEVDRLTTGFAQALSDRGVRAGDRVALLLSNEAAFPLTWIALSLLDAAAVPLNIRYQTADAEHVLRQAGVAAIVHGAQFEPLLARLPADLAALSRIVPAPELAAEAARSGRTGGFGLPDPAGTANIQFTSGTTGRPKGCVLPRSYWTRLGGSLVSEFPYLSADDVMLTAQPFSYIDPQWNVAAALLAGAELVILDGFHPSTFWAKVREHQVTYFYCLGAMPGLLLRMPPSPDDRRHRVRVVQCSAIPPNRHAALEERWGVPWYEAFGMTETGADLRVTDADHDELVGTGCLGGPVSYRKVQIVGDEGEPVAAGQTGEITLAGPGMMDGYDGDPEATVQVMRDGWFHTGDLGWMDGQGRVYHAGRIKDMIRRGGENVAAREVEEVLLAHPGIRLAAVTAVPDEIRGEEVKAYYVTGDGAEIDPAELAAYCRERLASFKVPRFWQPAADLPRTDSERVVKKQLSELPGPVFDTADGTWADRADDTWAGGA